MAQSVVKQIITLSALDFSLIESSDRIVITIETPRARRAVRSHMDKIPVQRPMVFRPLFGAANKRRQTRWLELNIEATLNHHTSEVVHELRKDASSLYHDQSWLRKLREDPAMLRLESTTWNWVLTHVSFVIPETQRVAVGQNFSVVPVIDRAKFAQPNEKSWPISDIAIYKQ